MGRYASLRQPHIAIQAIFIAMHSAPTCVVSWVGNSVSAAVGPGQREWFARIYSRVIPITHSAAAMTPSSINS